MNIKARTYELLFGHQSRAARAFETGMLLLILLNVLAVILETEPVVYTGRETWFGAFEGLSILVFTFEYALRPWSCTEDPRCSHPLSGRLRFMLQPMSLIDAAAFLPFYVSFARLDLRFMRAVRLFRLFRLFKVGRYSRSLRTLSNVVRLKKEELGITLFAGLILLVIASSLMYYVERDYQPDVFTNIPASMWWGVATLTTIGYGDIYPQTYLGKILGSLIAVLGIGLFPYPQVLLREGLLRKSNPLPGRTFALTAGRVLISRAIILPEG